VAVSALDVQSEKGVLSVERFEIFLQRYTRTPELETDVFLNSILKITRRRGCQKIYPQLA
jgi:hypothetical protein